MRIDLYKRLTDLLITILPALIAIMGIVIGAGIQYYTSRSLQFEQTSREYRLNAYRDFLAGQASYKRAKGGKQEESATKSILDSTLRMAIFSPGRVAVSVAEWLSVKRGQVACHGPRESFLKDLAMYHAMRGEAFQGDEGERLTDRNMAMLLHGCNLEMPTSGQ